MYNFSIENTVTYLTNLVLVIFIIVLLGVAFFFLAKLLIIWIKNRGREGVSLGSVLLQVALPRENEIKIDTAEQLFSSLSAIVYGSTIALKNSPWNTGNLKCATC